MRRKYLVLLSLKENWELMLGVNPLVTKASCCPKYYLNDLFKFYVLSVSVLRARFAVHV